MKHHLTTALTSLMLLVILVTLNSCGEKKNSVLGKGIPADYFPVKIGTTWEYEITIGNVEPMNYTEVSWPQGNIIQIIATKGRFMPLLVDSLGKNSYDLIVRVKSLAKKQGPLEYPNGLELEIVKDELGIYEYCSQVFWAISDDNRFMVNEIRVYPSDTPGAPMTGAWGRWSAENGYSIRVIFFGEQPNTAIGLGEEPKDVLLFQGLEGKKLHFTRQVDMSEPKNSSYDSSDEMFNQDFTEDVWYERGKGLVALIQIKNGEMAFAWRLKKLTLGKSKAI